MIVLPLFYACLIRLTKGFNEVKQRLGIIGAGQLGAYLCQACAELGVESRVLCHDDISPALKLSTDYKTASYDDLDAVRWLCENSDTVTFEFEDIPDATLEYLQSQSSAEVHPSPQTIFMLKNKARQKTWLADQGFPTSDFVVCDEGANYEDLSARFGERFVQKAQTGGIDGRGVQVINKENAAAIWQQPSLVEAFVPHVRELAVLIVRGAGGEVKSYPVVELRFCPDTNVLLIANSPARVSVEIEAAARKLGEDVISAMEGVGVFAIELFETEAGELLVNEISPRVHNSGHMTIEAHDESQYRQHIHAVLSEPLASTEQKHPGAMTNLLYSDNLAAFVGKPFGAWPTGEAANIHWYGKTAARTGRKMGHITATGESLELAVSRVVDASKTIGSDMGEIV